MKTFFLKCLYKNSETRISVVRRNNGNSGSGYRKRTDKETGRRRDAGTGLQSVRTLSARLFMNSSYLSSKSPFLPKKKEVK